MDSFQPPVDSSAGFCDPQGSVPGAMAYRPLDSRFRGNDSCVATAVEHVIAARAHVIPGPDRESSLLPTPMLLARLWSSQLTTADGRLTTDAVLSVSICVHPWLPLSPVPRGKGSANKKVIKQFIRTLSLSTKLFPEKRDSAVQNNFVPDTWRLVAGCFPIRVYRCLSVVNSFPSLGPSAVDSFTREGGRKLLKSLKRTHATRELSVSSFRRNGNSKRAVNQKRTRRRPDAFGGAAEGQL